jgi:hypothetical protein
VGVIEGERKLKLKVKNQVWRVHCIIIDKISILELIFIVHHRPLGIRVHVRICQENVMGLKVIKYVTFGSIFITNKNTLPGLRIKLGLMCL